MEFLKNHYEKVLLSVVLLGLAVAMALLPSRVPKPPEEAGAEPKKPLPKLNLTSNELAIAKLEKLKPLVLSGQHNLFNPVVWRRKVDTSLIKVDSDTVVGPGAVKIDRIVPLHFILSFDGLVGNTVQMGVVQETNKSPNARGKVIKYVPLNEKKELFTVNRVVGSPESPTGVVAQLDESHETVTIERDKPFKTVTGYAADLRYDPENLYFRDKRVGDALKFDGDTNNIVEINSNSVVLSASSGTRTTIKLNTAP
jgi:hypothetical protein